MGNDEKLYHKLIIEMDKQSLYDNLKTIEESLKGFTMNCKMTDIVKFYDELNETSQYNISQFLVIEMKSEIGYKNEPIMNEDYYINNLEIFYVFKVLGVDYDFLEFFFNDELSISDKSYDDEVNKLKVIYNGRQEFNSNSYATSEILMSKIASRISQSLDITDMFDYLINNCYPNMGGYAAVENAFIIGNLYFEGDKYSNSIIYFKKMKEINSISEITISEFYKKAAMLFYDKGLNPETLELLKFGLELNPKLSVKKIMKNLESTN